VNRPIKMVSATLVLGAGLSATGAAYAADDATFNQCWGQTTKEFAALGGPTHPGLGEHASDPPGFTPGEGGRLGVGNVSKTDPRFGGELSEGAQGDHAVFVGAQMELPECEGPDVP
jgi:hypothetical protein